jgi:hypothetical protein
VSHSRYKFVVVYVLYGACIQTSVSILCGLKRSHPDVACEVCHVGQCGILHTDYKQLRAYTWNGSLLLSHYCNFMLILLTLCILEF